MDSTMGSDMVSTRGRMARSFIKVCSTFFDPLSFLSSGAGQKKPHNGQRAVVWLKCTSRTKIPPRPQQDGL